MFAGYKGRQAETARVLSHDGWFRSGDVATVDADGYVTITDRIKDMIISGGENVYPPEIEKVLNDYPGVSECAVIGVPDLVWGEVPRAIVVPDAGAVIDPADVITFLRARLAHYKVPNRRSWPRVCPEQPPARSARQTSASPTPIRAQQARAERSRL